jgi:antiviral helicase SKI2
VVSTSKRPVPLQHYLFHDDNMYCLMKVENQFKPDALSEAVQRQKDKLKPKPKTAENAAMANQRQQEKAAIAAQFGAKTPKGGGGGRGGTDHSGRGGGGRGGAAVGGGSISGAKGQWLSLLRILRQGGREAAGGLEAIDFGVGYAAGMKSKGARAEMAQMTR